MKSGINGPAEPVFLIHSKWLLITVRENRKICWAFELPLPLGISINLPWDGYGYSLELQIVLNKVVHCGAREK